MINTSRGEIIDTNALFEGIENGIIVGAGMVLLLVQALILLKMNRKSFILTITIMSSRIETY